MYLDYYALKNVIALYQTAQALSSNYFNNNKKDIYSQNMTKIFRFLAVKH